MPKLPDNFDEIKAWDDMSEEEREEQEQIAEQIRREAEAADALVLSDGISEEERAREFLDHLTKAHEQHIEHVDSPLPGYVAIVIDTDVPIYTAAKPTQLHKGMYLLTISEDINEAYLCALDCSLPREILDKLESGEIESVEIAEGHRVITEATTLTGNVTVKRIETEAGKPLRYLEALTFLAMQDAKDEEERRRIFAFAYVPGQAKEAEPLEVLPSLATQSTKKVRKHVRPVTKVYQNITDPELFNARTLVDVTSRKEKKQGKEIYTAISLSYEGAGVEISRELKRTDTNIHDAIVSLYAAGATTFTPRQVYSALTGDDKRTNPKEEKLKEIEESLDKQRHTLITIDFTDELRGKEAMFEGEPITEYKRESFMLNASKETIRTAKGTETIGYVLHGAPILYLHAAIVGQVVDYPQKLLTALREAGNSTNTNIAVRQYLLTRIQQAKNEKNSMSNKIRYSTIFEEAELHDLDRTQKSRHVGHVKKCLDILTAEGFIQGFQEYKEKRAAVGVEIFL